MIDTIEKYKIFDLILLSIIAVISEYIGSLIHTNLSGAGFQLSFSILIAMIAIIRWGEVGSVVYSTAGVVNLFIMDGNLFDKILLYPIANLFIILSTTLFKYFDRHRLNESKFRLLIYVILSYLSVAIGKGFATLVIERVFFGSIAIYMIGQLFNILITFLIFLIIRRTDGLLVDMEMYFKEREMGDE